MAARTRRIAPWLGIAFMASAVLVVNTRNFFRTISQERFLSGSPASYHQMSNAKNLNKLGMPIPITNSSATSDTANAKAGDIFAPGSLSISRKESYERCYVDPLRYKNHFRPSRTCAISEKYNLTYFMIAKAGSSTCRKLMGDTFEATERQCGNNAADIGTDNDSMHHFTIFREPSSRFLSSYQEAVQRDFHANHPNNVPPEYKDSFVEPIKHLTLKDLYETDDGSAAFMYAIEKFMKTYDGRVPFNGHLRLQLPRLYNPKSQRTIPLDAVFDTKTMQQNFEALAQQVDATKPEEVIRAYDRGDRRINMTSLSMASRREICQLAAIDYCCLNYELPPECEDSVQCQWTHKPDIVDELLIDTISPYPPIVPS